MSEQALIPDGTLIKVQPGYLMARIVKPRTLSPKAQEKLDGAGRIAKSFPLAIVIHGGNTKFEKGGCVLYAARDQVGGRPLLNIGYEGRRAERMVLMPKEAVVAEVDLDGAEWLAGLVPDAVTADLEKGAKRGRGSKTDTKPTPKKDAAKDPMLDANPEPLTGRADKPAFSSDDPEAEEPATSSPAPTKARRSTGENAAQSAARAKAEAAAKGAQVDAAEREAGK